MAAARRSGGTPRNSSDASLARRVLYVCAFHLSKMLRLAAREWCTERCLCCSMMSCIGSVCISFRAVLLYIIVVRIGSRSRRLSRLVDLSTSSSTLSCCSTMYARPDPQLQMLRQISWGSDTHAGFGWRRNQSPIWRARPLAARAFNITVTGRALDSAAQSFRFNSHSQ